MRTPANSTKHFINQILTAMNSFFSKVSQNKIQFQVSEHYALPKKVQTNNKGKKIKKISKGKTQISPEKLKLLKKAFKKFRELLLSKSEFKMQTKQLNEKQVNKRVKFQWKKLTHEQQSKWCDSARKKSSIKIKNNQTKNNQKQKPNNNGKQQKQQKQNEKSDD